MLGTVYDGRQIGDLFGKLGIEMGGLSSKSQNCLMKRNGLKKREREDRLIMGQARESVERRIEQRFQARDRGRDPGR